MKAFLKFLIHICIFPFFILVLTIIYFFSLFTGKKTTKPRLVWGPVPLISNKYWSEALKKAGYPSETLMSNYYSSIHKKEDFDKYTEDTLCLGILRDLLRILGLLEIGKMYRSFIYAVLHYDIFHHHFHGGFIGNTPFWGLEAPILHCFKKKIVITAYGRDFYRYSKVEDVSWRNGLLNSYPEMAKEEKHIERKVQYWTRHADTIINGLQIDGMGRWDVIPYNMVTINTSEWFPREQYSPADGKNGTVYIAHTPNHRGVKGSEFIIQAVEMLKKEGLQVELLLIEKMQNDEVRKLLQEKADLLVEQLLLGYALSAVEGMACGLPVLSNLSNEIYTRMFRRFSYLNECPILSTTPENILDNLRVLVTNPQLRETLGKAGKQYVQKYHSEKTAQYMFGAVYDKIWFGKEVNLLNLFHPLLSNQPEPPVVHPLHENRLI
ncbi:MAG: glycosyltransferase [Bacteroidota bacterium]